FGQYVPQNYGGRFHGWVSVEKALVESYNVPAVAMLREVGIDEAMELVRAAGIPLLDNDRTLALALGGLESGVSPLQMAQAYTMLSNQGVWSESRAIKKIKNNDNVILYEAKMNQKQLLTP